jgi:hypothetical protein
VIFYVLHDFAGTRDIIASDDEIHLTLPFQTEASFAITQILSGKITSLLSAVPSGYLAPFVRDMHPERNNKLFCYYVHHLTFLLCRDVLG